MKIGDQVMFHVLTEHQCDGQDCRCPANLHLPAIVLHVHPDEVDEHERSLELPQALALDVQFADEDIVTRNLALPDGAVTHVTRFDYTTRQSHSYEASTEPPASGTWTQIN